MAKIDRRDFLLHVAPLVAAPALIIGSVEETEAQQIKNFRLITPTQNAQFNVGQTVQISVGLIRTLYPKITRINFKANGQIIGTAVNRPYQMNWQPTQAGNYTLTAEAVLINGSVVISMSTVVSVASSTLEVLYDTLGNATDGWGWAGQGSYTSVFSNTLGLNYVVVTSYIGTLSTAKRLRGFECAVNARNTQSQTNMPPSYFLGRFYIGIWRRDVGTFYQAPLGGSLTLLNANLSDPNVGSVSTPVGTVGGGSAPLYVIGWDNLDVLLPANVVIEISFYAEGIQLGDSFAVAGSSRPGPNMLGASSNFGNYSIAQPMATRIKVSN